MQVNLVTPNYYNNRTNSVPAFGTKCPFGDVVTIMSHSYIGEKAMKSEEKTVAKLLNKAVSDSPAQKDVDFHFVADALREKYPELASIADAFRASLDKINKNHFAISKKDSQSVLNKAIQEYGSDTVDVELVGAKIY